MTRPVFADCVCGHSKAAHEADLAPQCIQRGCECLRYRPQLPSGRPMTGPPTLRPTPPVPAPPRVVPTPAQPAASPPPEPKEPEVGEREQRPVSLEGLLRAGKQSAFQRTVKLTEKIAVELNDLRGRLADEREAAIAKEQAQAKQQQIRQEIEDLERQLKEKREQLRGNPMPDTPGGSKQGEKEHCPECGLPFVNVGAHRAKAHGYRKAG